MSCTICGKEFRVGDGYAFYRDDTEKICHSCHADWFGGKLHEEHEIRAKDLPKDCPHPDTYVARDPEGIFWRICRWCGEKLGL
jgi:ribosomal protein L24E